MPDTWMDLMGNGEYYLAIQAEVDEPSNPASALVALSKADGMAQGRRIIVKCPYVITSSSWLYSLAVGFLGATEVTKAEAQAGPIDENDEDVSGESIQRKHDIDNEDDTWVWKHHGSRPTRGGRRDKAPKAPSIRRINQKGPNPSKDCSDHGPASHSVREPDASHMQQKKAGNEKIQTADAPSQAEKEPIAKNERLRAASSLEL
ncbi:hypothetical protein DDE82_009053 [Stemphylium lycopersici]|nr:hypothetical protein TW65_00662 [Stemphylium lycopersici]RAQ98640.1 hypothetical protein DDE82_009053 [Stemphylium lycopersici]